MNRTDRIKALTEARSEEDKLRATAKAKIGSLQPTLRAIHENLEEAGEIKLADDMGAAIIELKRIAKAL